MNEYYDHGGSPESEARFETWNALPELPLPGQSPPLDTWLESKGLQRTDLLRVGARWGTYAGMPAFVYLFPDGLKYRALNGERSSELGVKWNRSKIIRAQTGDATELIVAEGETDAALLSRLCPDRDVAVLPAGANHVPPGDDWSKYDRVYLGHDADEAGDSGAEALAARYPQARRTRPPDGRDWCDIADELGEAWLPEDWLVAPKKLVYSIAEIVAIDFGSEQDNNWFANGIVPIRGEVAVHGPMKSLKSVIGTELGRAIATGTPFAGYVEFIHDKPGRVLMFQYEIPPWAFQRRMLGMSRVMSPEEWELFSHNLAVFGVGDGRLPRLKMNEGSFRANILRAAEAFEADVLIFDPIQKMTGGASTDKANEMEPLLDMFAVLMQDGFTVIYCHHDNKAERNKGTAYSMSGTQRFGADADSICSVYHTKYMMDDRNDENIKERNLSWELRNGVCSGRSIRAVPDVTDPDFMHVTWDVPILGGKHNSEGGKGNFDGQPAIY